jgi:hypothetical protein
MHTLTGKFFITTKTGLLFQAESLTPTPNFIKATHKGLETHLQLKDINTILQANTDKTPLRDQDMLATFLMLENNIIKYEKITGKKISCCICGATSLSITLIPNRATEDIDIITNLDENPPLDEFLNQQEQKTENPVEILDETSMFLMGKWRSRTSTLTGPQGKTFQILHPLDTLMQKLLRWDTEKFLEKDTHDITEILKAMKPSRETLIALLTENPFRYAQNTGFLAPASEAIQHNTQWLLDTFLPETTLDWIKKEAQNRHIKQLGKAAITTVQDIDLRQTIREITLSP